MEGKIRVSKIPPMDSIEELASFWDTHDVTDFEEEHEEVREPLFDSPYRLTLRLTPDLLNSLHRLAALKGVDDAELVQEWVIEKLSTH